MHAKAAVYKGASLCIYKYGSVGRAKSVSAPGDSAKPKESSRFGTGAKLN